MKPTTETLAACTEFDMQIWSDLYRDAHGFRPRFDLSNYSAAELDALWLSTYAALEDSMEQDERNELEAELEFDSALQRLMGLGAGSLRQAFRWLLDAEGVDLRNLSAGEVKYELEGFCWSFGLPFRMVPELQDLAS